MQHVSGWIWILILACGASFGCKANSPTPSVKKTLKKTNKTTSRPTSRRAISKTTTPRKVVTPTSLVPPKSWVAARVAASKQRLLSSEAGTWVWKAIQAQGGLQRWFDNGPLFFRFVYKPLKGRRARDSYQTIDTWSSRARHELASDRKVQFGWDGKQAWRMPRGKKTGMKPRFWSLTPYYFVAVPFVFGDKGVVLKKEKDIRFEKRTYVQIRVTYKAGVGDAPKDFYVVWIDKKSHRVGGVRYIVSYPGFFPKGGHSPEKFMAYDGRQVVSGIAFPKTFRTFTWNGKRPVKLVTRSRMSDVSFRPKTPLDFFSVPANAEIRKGW